MAGDFGKGGKTLKFQVVDELCDRHSVKDLCEYLGVSRSGYYRYLSRKNKPDKDEELEEKIRYIYQLRNKTYGYRRIQAELLRLYGLRVNHKKVVRIMQKLGIQAVIRRKRFYQNQYRTPMGVRIAGKPVKPSLSCRCSQSKVGDGCHMDSRWWAYLIPFRHHGSFQQ